MKKWLHSYTGCDKGSYLSQKEYDLNPSTLTAGTTSLHDIRASPPGTTVKRTSSLKLFQGPLTYHQKYDACKINNLQNLFIVLH